MGHIRHMQVPTRCTSGKNLRMLATEDEPNSRLKPEILIVANMCCYTWLNVLYRTQCWKTKCNIAPLCRFWTRNAQILL